MCRAIKARLIGQDGAVARRELVSLNDFLSAKRSLTEKSWMPDVPSPWDILHWSLRKLGVDGGIREGEFVVMASVQVCEQRAEVIADNQDTAQRISTSIRNSSSLVYSLQTFTHEFGGILTSKTNKSLSANDISVLLAYLSRDIHRASIHTTSDPYTGEPFTTIKFSASGTSPQRVSEADIAIAKMHTIAASLNTQMSSLVEHIAHFDKTAREAISAQPQSKTRALAALRSKKVAENNLETRSKSLEQVENILRSVEDAQGQVQLVSAMETSSRVLKDLNTQIGGVARVEQLMDEMGERMHDVEDVDKILAEGGYMVTDEVAVDEELEALEQEQKKDSETKAEKEREELLQSAPSVPHDIKSNAEDVPRQSSRMPLDVS